MSSRAWALLAAAAAIALPWGIGVAELAAYTRNAHRRMRDRYADGTEAFVIDRDQWRDMPPLPPRLQTVADQIRTAVDAVYDTDPIITRQYEEQP